jgi:hypothetical protein
MSGNETRPRIIADLHGFFGDFGTRLVFMDIENSGLRCAAVTKNIIGAFYDVYNELGCGFLESVYEESLVIALRARGLVVERQVAIPVWFRQVKVGDFGRT